MKKLASGGSGFRVLGLGFRACFSDKLRSQVSPEIM